MCIDHLGFASYGKSISPWKSKKQTNGSKSFGFCILLVSSIIYWKSKKQTNVFENSIIFWKSKKENQCFNFCIFLWSSFIYWKSKKQADVSEQKYCLELTWHIFSLLGRQQFNYLKHKLGVIDLHSPTWDT